MMQSSDNKTLLSMLKLLLDSSDFQADDAVRQFLNNPREAYPTGNINEFAQAAIHHVIHASQDLAIGMKIAQFISPNVFHGLGYLFMTAPDLLSSFRHVSELPALYHHVVNIRTDIEGEHLWVRIDSNLPYPLDRKIACEGGIAILINYLQWVLNDPVDSARIQFAHEPLIAPYLYHRYLGIAPDFKQSGNALILPLELTRQTLPGSDADYYQHLQVKLKSLQESLSNSFTDRVRQAIRDRLPKGQHTKQSLVSDFGMSEKTLDRRLADEQTSFRELVAETRLELAQYYLNQPDLSLDQVAEMLGYSDGSAFSKAYKSWTGKSPRS